MSTWILEGDCVESLRGLPDACIDAVVTDPPYGLSKEPDMVEVLRHWLAGDDYQHTGGGFMGKSWDSFVPGPEVWREVLRVLKPGGHALVFSGTRTYDLTVLAIRIAGFEIRDQLAWMYGSGFPKSLDVSKAIDASYGAVREVLSERPAYGLGDGRSMCGHADGATAKVTAPATPEAAAWSGWGTALKPAQEPIVLARKPLVGTVAANVLQHGTGGINVDACRIGTSGGTKGSEYAKTGLFGVGGKCTIEQLAAGRWPANVLFDEDAAAVLDAQSGYQRDGVAVKRNTPIGKKSDATSYNLGNTGRDATYGGGGGASRFFYVAKASRAEREAGLEAAGLPIRSGGELTDREDGSDGLNSPRAGAGRKGGRRNHHPTVKPVALMRYLIRLITPPGGLVLDPFAGSGTTGIAAKLEGFRFVGCEMEPEYVTLARARIEAA